MINDELLRMLRCPIDGKLLGIAEESLIRQLNLQIAEGVVRDRQDQKVTEPIECGLKSQTANCLFPVRNGIPSLLAGEAILLGEKDEIQKQAGEDSQV